MKHQGVLYQYGRMLQEQETPATNPNEREAHGRRTVILIVLIVFATLALLVALLYRESRKAKTQGNSKDSQKSNNNTSTSINLTTTDTTITLSAKATTLPLVYMIQNKVSTLVQPRRKKDFKSCDDQEVKNDHVSHENYSMKILSFDSRKLTTLQQGWPTFNMDELLKSSAQPLFGMGVFGSAYKVTHNGLPPIVIRHLQGVNIGFQEFKNRIGDLAKLNHANILPILAYYFSENEKILLYEYLNYGNLATHLHGQDTAPLEWPRRMEIAMDVAHGIAYLHSKGRNKGLLHGNIKPSNVVLGANGRACLTDIGLAHLVRACPATLNVGYRAPEVAHMNRALTHKSDVYSYGVLLLELLTAKQPVVPSSNQVLDLPRLIHSCIHEEWTAEIFDPRIPLRARYEEEMVLMLKIAMECVQAAPRDRPSMAKVVGMIQTMREFDTPSGSAYTDISTPNDQFDVV